MLFMKKKDLSSWFVEMESCRNENFTISVSQNLIGDFIKYVLGILFQSNLYT